MNQKLIELVKSSDIPNVKKLMTIGFIERANDREQSERDDRMLIEKTASYKKSFEILLSTDEVKIYKIFSKEDWELKYPFRVIYKMDNGKWDRIATVSPSFDVAYLHYLEHRHIGQNSQFVYFAAKMLEIKIN